MPDHTANRLLSEFGFEPAKGEPEHLLHANAVPKSDFKACYELRVEGDERHRRGRLWFVYPPEGKERLLDEGRILEIQRLHPTSSSWMIKMEGRVMAQWKIFGPRLGRDIPLVHRAPAGKSPIVAAPKKEAEVTIPPLKENIVAERVSPAENGPVSLRAAPTAVEADKETPKEITASQEHRAIAGPPSTIGQMEVGIAELFRKVSGGNTETVRVGRKKPPARQEKTIATATGTNKKLEVPKSTKPTADDVMQAICDEYHCQRADVLDVNKCTNPELEARRVAIALCRKDCRLSRVKVQREYEWIPPALILDAEWYVEKEWPTNGELRARVGRIREALGLGTEKNRSAPVSREAACSTQAVSQTDLGVTKTEPAVALKSVAESTSGIGEALVKEMACLCHRLDSIAFQSEIERNRFRQPFLFLLYHGGLPVSAIAEKMSDSGIPLPAELVCEAIGRYSDLLRNAASSLKKV